MIQILSILLTLYILWMLFGPMGFAPAVLGFPTNPPKRPERKAWQDLLMFGKGGGDAPEADPRIGEAALKNAQLGDDWLTFAKEQSAIGNERQKVTDDLTGQVTTQQLSDMKKSSDRSDQQWDRYTTLFQPIEDRMVNDANTYDTPEKQAQAAAQAKADVLTNAAQAKASSGRNMAAMGINPNSGRWAANDSSADLTTALASAGAQNNAREGVKATGMALRESAANFGRGNTATAAQQLGLGTNSGNSAVGNNIASNSSFNANNQIMTNGINGAMQGNNSSANILNNQYQNQLSGYNTQQQASAANTAGIASTVGTIGGVALIAM